MTVVSITHSVGRDGVNAGPDVQKVADLLAALGYMERVRFAPRRETSGGRPIKQEAPQMLVDAICQFQSDCGRVRQTV